MLDLIVTIDNNFLEIAKHLEDELEALVDETLENIHANVERAMELPKYGRVYGNHIASQPGEPPAIDTEDLIKSGTIEKQGRFEGTLTYTSDHAAAMEYGTVHVAPRPFLNPTVETERPNWDAGLKKVLDV